MDFLKELFGDKTLTYDELANAVNAHNGNEANREKQIKIGNLGTGEYTSTAKYKALEESLNGKQTELDTANGLIAELKKSTKGNEELQGKITGYETQVADLQKQLAETKIKAAVKVALLSEKAVDIDYVTYKLSEKMNAESKTLELDENDNIKGWNDILSDLKTQLPAQFQKGDGKKYEENPLPQNPPEPEGVTKEQFDKMGYQSRLKLKQEQPEVYAQMTGKTTI